jgi:hypothetical protein
VHRSGGNDFRKGYATESTRHNRLIIAMTVDIAEQTFWIARHVDIAVTLMTLLTSPGLGGQTGPSVLFGNEI